MRERLDGQTSGRLICVECTTQSDDTASRWRAYLGSDEEVVIFCPVCAAREFGNAARATGSGGES